MNRPLGRVAKLLALFQGHFFVAVNVSTMTLSGFLSRIGHGNLAWKTNGVRTEQRDVRSKHVCGGPRPGKTQTEEFACNMRGLMCDNSTWAFRLSKIQNFRLIEVVRAVMSFLKYAYLSMPGRACACPAGVIMCMCKCM